MKVRGMREGERRFVSKWKSQLNLPFGNIAVLLCHRSQKTSQAFSFRIFPPLYNPFLVTIEFEDKLENKSDVTFTPISVKGKTKSSKIKLLLNSICARLYASST